FWRPLLHLKFFDLAGQISAAWMWQRIKRQVKSRKSLLEERLGYIEGGSETLVKALAGAIKAMGGEIHLSKPATRIVIENGAVTGVEAGGQHFPADQVISTIATPYVPALLGDAPDSLRAAYARIKNIGVICVVHKLARQVSPNFWV